MIKDKVIVWGTGVGAQELVKIIDSEQIFCFADNNEQLWGKTYLNKKIVSMKELLLLPEEYLIVISTAKYEDEIKKQLLNSGITNFVNVEQFKINRIFGESRQKERRIILLNTHDNINIGDHLITVAELYFFRKYMPDYEVLEIPLTLCSRELEYIHQFIRTDDLLVVTGGGFLGSLWINGGESNVRRIVQRFEGNRIIVFPQTMYFESSIEGKQQEEISKSIYNEHAHLTFCFRDALSYELGSKLFGPHVKKNYVPDIVALLDRSDEIYMRSGVLICIREDKERTVSEECIEELERKFINKNFYITKMSMLADQNISSENRMAAINSKLYQIQTSRLVITDRLHCMLLCAISGTPCMVFDNLSGKVHGVYHWIQENPYICLVENDTDIWENVEKLLDMPYMAYCKENIEREFEALAELIKSGEV